MKKDATMEINHETAKSLWNKRYGKATRVKDFAGREMDKGSYGDRNSDYGWNLDHILPQSQGGKDTESNLICCHIKTNDEKADKYPVFNANGKTFEIVKVENHYEIKEKNPKKEQEDEEENNGINFLDHSAGIAFFKECKKAKYFTGTIHIRIDDVKEPAILDFIKKVFDGYEISFMEEYNRGYYLKGRKTYFIHIKAKSLERRSMVNELLDNCVLLNTYFNKYFKRLDIIGNFDIVYSIYCLDYQFEIDDFKEKRVDYNMTSMIHINELVRINSDASKMKIINEKDYYEYDYYFTKLSENLERGKK